MMAERTKCREFRLPGGHVNYSLAIGFSEIRVSNSEHIHLYSCGQYRDNRMHVLRNTRGGVSCDCCPDNIDPPLKDAVLMQKSAGEMEPAGCLKTIE